MDLMKMILFKKLYILYIIIACMTNFLWFKRVRMDVRTSVRPYLGHSITQRNITWYIGYPFSHPQRSTYAWASSPVGTLFSNLVNICNFTYGRLYIFSWMLSKSSAADWLQVGKDEKIVLFVNRQLLVWFIWWKIMEN